MTQGGTTVKGPWEKGGCEGHEENAEWEKGEWIASGLANAIGVGVRSYPRREVSRRRRGWRLCKIEIAMHHKIGTDNDETLCCGISGVNIVSS